MRYQKNQNNLDFFAQLALLILRGQWGWFRLRSRLCGSLYHLICHLGLLYHYRVSCGLDVLHHSYLLPSSFLLGDLPNRHMWGVFHRSYIGFSWLHIVIVWQFLPSDFVFFYSAENKLCFISSSKWPERRQGSRTPGLPSNFSLLHIGCCCFFFYSFERTIDTNIEHIYT